MRFDMINKERLIKLTRQLIRINSQNPGGEESEIALFVKGYLNKLGLKSKIYEFKKSRSNIIACLKGNNPKSSLVITPHLDTVPAGRNWRYPPLAAKISGGKLYGLGATDCKCNLAVSLEVINSLLEEKRVLDYSLIFCATADEESGSNLGLIPLLDKGILKADAAVVLDADDFRIIVAQKGLIHLKVRIEGKRAHGAYPWLGISAIDIAINILKELKAHKLGSKENPYLKPATMNIGTIRGGDKVNIVADWCEFELDFRFLPGEPADKILSDVKHIIGRHTKKFKLEINGIQKAYHIDEKHPLVEGWADALKEFKIKPVICGSEGATTISFFQEKNIPAIAAGFGDISCAHSTDEYVKLDNLYKGGLVLEEFLKRYTFTEPPTNNEYIG